MLLMKTLTIGFSRPVSHWKPYANLIMWYDGTNYDHAFIDLSIKEMPAGMIYQSSGLRTNFMGGEYFQSINIIEEKFQIDIRPEHYKSVIELCVSREGLPYGILEVLGKMIVCSVFAISGGKWRIKNPFKSVDTDCITEVAKILSLAVGIQTPLDMDTVTVKPFRDWLAGLPNVRKVQ